MKWSDKVNGFLYEFVGLVLQASSAHNVTAPGGRKYNVPSEKIIIDNTVAEFYPDMTSYTQLAIAGSDDFNDYNTTIRDIFDFLVENTREVSTACKLYTVPSYMFVLLTRPQSSRNRLVTRVRTGKPSLTGPL